MEVREQVSLERIAEQSDFYQRHPRMEKVAEKAVYGLVGLATPVYSLVLGPAYLLGRAGERLSHHNWHGDGRAALA